METPDIAELLNDTLSPDGDSVRTATETLDRLSLLPNFPISLLSIVSGGGSLGLRIAAATYLKNSIRRNIDGNGQSSKTSKEFKDRLVRTLLQAEAPILKVLVEAFRSIAVSEFVKENLWSELVPELRSVIFNSNLIHQGPTCEWNTINALTVLQALLRPFQYFLNPKVAKEPVPPQLELISHEIIAPLLPVFHLFVEKALVVHAIRGTEREKTLLIISKCINFAVKSYMPSSLPPLLPSFCHDLFKILGSLSFDDTISSEDEFILRRKTGKRSLLIFCALITRHRKYSDKLMPDIINSVLNIVKCSINIGKLDFPSERIVSVAFDVISHVLETGPGWRIVSPHFPSLLDTAIFPALVINEKDTLQWEEDPDEYIRKNLPSDFEEISGWRDDLFIARKSAINLLGVMSMSKGPPVKASALKRKKSEKGKRNGRCASMGELLVLPFLSKFPIPSNVSASQTRTINEYYGVLMAYGGLQDFLREQKPEYTTTLLRTRVLPLYSVSVCNPYLIATANWVLGELAPCLPEEMRAEVYTSLIKGLIMPDIEDISCYPVRTSAAGAITGLLDNDYMPPEWMPLLQVVVNRIGNDDEETSVLYQLLNSVVKAGGEGIALHIPDVLSVLARAVSKCIPDDSEPWSQVVIQGFGMLASMAQSWEDSMPEDNEQNELSNKWARGQDIIARAFSVLLQRAWLLPLDQMKGEISTPPCIDDSSTLLRVIMGSVSSNEVSLELQVSELLLTWADLIAEWHDWEELEDSSVFECIKEAVNLHAKFGLKNFIKDRMPPPPAPPVPQRSIIESIGVFVGEAISHYPSATWGACSCVHVLLHVPTYSSETDGVKQSLVSTLSQAALTRLRDIQIKPCSTLKPLMLAISSCYLCYPVVVEEVMKQDDLVWVSALRFISTSSFEPTLSTESEIKLVVLTLTKVVERLLAGGSRDFNLLHECFSSLMDTSVQLKEKEVQEEEDEDEESADDDSGVEDEDRDDNGETDEDNEEDSADEELEETQEQFLDRYAKAAVALENGDIVDEEDSEDQELDIELGSLEETDHERAVWSLIETYHQVLIKSEALPSELVSSFLDTFPDYACFFQQR